jgi:hypothetical protein
MSEKDNDKLCDLLVKRSWVLEKAIVQFSADVIEDFEQHYIDLKTSYENHPSLMFLSSNYQLDQLQDFIDWLPDLKTNQNKIIPLLVAKMLHGDPLALSMYENIYAGNQSLVITYGKILDDEKLTDEFVANGLGVDSLAMVNAEHWLQSETGKNLLCLGDIGCLQNHNQIFN